MRMGALAAGAERLGCGCGATDCGCRGARVQPQRCDRVVAEQASVEGSGAAPGVMLGTEGLNNGGDGRRDWPERAAAAADSARGRARAALHPVGQARRFRPMPRSDVPAPAVIARPWTAMWTIPIAYRDGAGPTRQT